MKGMKILQVAVAVFAITATTANCDLINPSDDNDDTTLLLAALALQCNGISGDISSDLTIKATDDVSKRTLCGAVNVTSGATLTIEAGTTILGAPGSSLWILEGGKMTAIGTSSNPIVFTSSRADGSRATGDWGGIVLIGKAPAKNSKTTEGTVKYTYGSGSTSADNSGTMQYVRVEFAGYEVAAGDELNGISLYSVGSGTTLDHIQVHMPLDDGFEFFGGRVSLSQALVTGTSDDAFDADNGYQGTWTDIMEYRYPTAAGITASSDPRGWEIDGRGSDDACAGDCTTVTVHGAFMWGEDSLGSTHQANKIREGATVTINTRDVAFENYGKTLALDCDGTGSDHPANVTVTLTGVSYFSGMGTSITSTGSSTCSFTITSRATTTYIASSADEWSINSPSTAPTFQTTALNAHFSEADWYSQSWINWKNN